MRALGVVKMVSGGSRAMFAAGFSAPRGFAVMPGEVQMMLRGVF